MLQDVARHDAVIAFPNGIPSIEVGADHFVEAGGSPSGLLILDGHAGDPVGSLLLEPATKRPVATPQIKDPSTVCGNQTGDRGIHSTIDVAFHWVWEGGG